MKSTYKLVKRDGLYRLTDAAEKNEHIIYNTGKISYIVAKYEIERNLELFLTIQINITKLQFAVLQLLFRVVLKKLPKNTEMS